MHTNIVPFTKLMSLPLMLSFSACNNPQQNTKELLKEENEQPNIVILFADDLGCMDLGYQNKKFVTPNIDQLKKDGMFFSDCRVTSPTCSPSRATLLTGNHAVDIGIVRHVPSYDTTKGFTWTGIPGEEYNYWQWDPSQMPSRNWLPLEEQTYAEALKELGYYNIFVGKWHLGEGDENPIHQGFEEEYCITPWGAPARYYPPFFAREEGSPIIMDTTQQYITDSLTDITVNWIKAYDKTQPFCLSFYYYAVHDPIDGRIDWVKYYEKQGLEGEEAQYAAMVSTMDESVGRVIEALKEKGLENSTMVLFSSDQGGRFSNAPYRGAKMGGQTLCEGDSRVSLIVKYPGKIEAGTQCDVPVSTTDLFPTFISMAGGSLENNQVLDGVDLSPLLLEKGEIPNRSIVSYRSYEDQYASIRKDNWKFIAYRSGKKELFDLSKDTGEANDLSKQKPELLVEFSEELINWEKEKGVYLGENKTFEKK